MGLTWERLPVLLFRDIVQGAGLRTSVSLYHGEKVGVQIDPALGYRDVSLDPEKKGLSLSLSSHIQVGGFLQGQGKRGI